MNPYFAAASNVEIPRAPEGGRVLRTFSKAQNVKSPDPLITQYLYDR